MLKGISPATECALQRRGINQKKQLVTLADALFSPKQAIQVKNSYERLEKVQQIGLLDCMVNAFPCGHRIRVLHDYFQTVAFLDIETDGMSCRAAITCISVLLNKQMSTFVRGINLDQFLEIWVKCGILVTFNGKRFDIPKILNEFNLSTIPAHIDLMDEAAHYGFRGGLKKITAKMGFIRREKNCLSGSDAITNWNEYMETGNEDARSRLISYNQDDVYALEWVYRKLLKLSLQNTLITTTL